MRRQAAGLAGRAMSAFAPSYSAGVVNFSTASTGGWRGASAMYRSGAPTVWAPGSMAAIRTFPARAFSAVPPAHPAPTPNSKMQDEFISGTSAAYLESLEDQWREDPNSVPASWASLLRQMGEWTRLVYRSTGYSRARTRAVRAARLIPPHAGAHRGARYFPNNARRFAPR